MVCQLVQSATNLDISSAGDLLIEGNSVRITGLIEPIDAQDAATKNYVDLTNFQNYNFRNVNQKTALPGGVPNYNGSNPIITNQYQLPQGNYYFKKVIQKK